MHFVYVLIMHFSVLGTDLQIYGATYASPAACEAHLALLVPPTTGACLVVEPRK